MLDIVSNVSIYRGIGFSVRDACMQNTTSVIFGILLSGGRGLFVALSASGQAKGPSVHNVTHVWIPAELRGACSDHLKSLSCLFCHGFRAVEPSTCVDNPTSFCPCPITRSALALFYPLRAPPAVQHQPYCFYPLRYMSRRRYIQPAGATAAAHASNIIRICCT